MEKDVKKKILTMVMALIMCMSVFTGCSLVERNDKNYFNAVVATVTYTDGDKDEITKRELITAYNSYGYNYVDNYNYTQKQAVDLTLETIINKKITIKSVEKNFEEANEQLLIGSETTYLWDKTYESLYSNLKSYLKEEISESEEEELTPDASVFSDYQSQAYLDANLVVRKKTPATTIRNTYEERAKDGIVYDLEYKNSDNKYVFKELLYNKLYDIIGDGKDSNSKSWKYAFNKYISAIKENYPYMDFAEDEDCFYFEIDRVYNILKENYLVEKYEVIYNTQAQQDVDIANVTASDILKYYSAKVRADYTKYEVEKDSSYSSSMLSDIANMDYVLNNGSKYFYVAPIKIALTSQQENELASLKTQLEAGDITQSRYNTLFEELYKKVNATVRNSETGEKTSQTVSPSDLLKNIVSDISNYRYDENENEAFNQNIERLKAEAYRKYFYLYNDEDTLKGKDYNAVFGVDSTNNVLASDTYGTNEDICNAILALYNNGDARVGDVSNLVQTDTGYYIFFFAGFIENPLNVIDKNFDATNLENIKVLASKRLNVFSSKTIFDVIYESLANENFSVFENMNIDYLRSTLTTKIEAVENNIKDLY